MAKKKVTFSDNVEVRDISIDRSEHVREIKNPQNFIVGTPPQKSRDDGNVGNPQSSTRWYTRWYVVVIFLMIMCLGGYFVWKKYTSSK